MPVTVTEPVGVVSLRHDVAPALLANYCARVVCAHQLSAFTTTESRSRRLVRKLRRQLPEGWRVVRRHEYLLAWDTRVWGKRSRPKLRTLAGIVYARGRRFRMAELELRHRVAARRVRLQSAHAPASIGGGHTSWRSSSPRRVRAAQAGWARWGRHNARLARRRPDRVVVSHMDANLDQRSAHWRSYLADELGAPSVYAEHRPRAGTHGTRLIDTAHVAGARATDPVVSKVDRPRGLDHAALVYLLGLEVEL